MKQNRQEFNISDFHFQLSEKTLIEASAGTGKTYTLSHFYIHLLLEKKLAVQNILVLTFTEAATQDLIVKIREKIQNSLRILLNQDKNIDLTLSDYLHFLTKVQQKEDLIVLLRNALLEFNQAAIHTIHGFCYKALSENIFVSGKTTMAELLADETSFFTEILHDFYRIALLDMDPLFLQYLQADGFLKKRNALPLALFKTISTFPHISITPQNPELDELRYQQIVNRTKALYMDIRDLLGNSTQKSEAMQEVMDNQILHKTITKPEAVASRFSSCSDFFLYDHPFFMHCEGIDYLTPSSFRSHIKKGGNDNQIPHHKLFQQMEFFIESQSQLRELIQKKDLHFQWQLIDFFHKRFQAEKEKNNIFLYSDLLHDLKNGLQQQNTIFRDSLRSTYKAALIDEHQDTDGEQYAIISSIFDNKHDPVLFVGDPKQAIYHFRGADIYTYIHTANAIADNRYLTLTRNWRSQENLVSAILRLFERNVNPFFMTEIHLPEVHSAVIEKKFQIVAKNFSWNSLHFYFMELSDRGTITKEKMTDLVSKHIALQIEILLDNGKIIQIHDQLEISINASDIAILVRTKSQGEKVQQALHDKGIPSLLFVEESVLQSNEFRYMAYLFDAVLHPWNKQKIATVLITPIFQKDSAYIEAFYQDQNHSIQDLFYTLFETLYSHEFMSMFIYLMHWREKDSSIRSKILSLKNGNQVYTNLMHLADFIHREKLQKKRDLESLFHWYLKSAADVNSVLTNEELQLTSDDPHIKIMTIHKSKGLEFPIVFAPFLWDQSIRKQPEHHFFFYDENNELKIDLNGKDSSNYKKKELHDFSESIRLAYVALTRAKFQCFVHWGKVKEAHTSPLFYFMHGPQISPNHDSSYLNNAKEIYKNLSSDDMLQILQTFYENNSELISYSQISENLINNSISPDKATKPTVVLLDKPNQKFDQNEIASSWQQSSFSSLILGAKEDDATEKIQPIFKNQSLPSGKNFGNMIHSIFEQIPFPAPPNDVIKLLCDKATIENSFSVEISNQIFEMILAVIRHPLPGLSEFALQTLTESQITREMPFTLFVSNGFLDSWLDFMANNNQKDIIKNYFYSLKKKNIGFEKGYLKGFVDFIFQHDNKFYIIDWKSNVLGNHYEDYNQIQMTIAMAHHHYYLQLYLYTAALHQFLSLNLKNFSYSQHFGGIYYIFTRGVHPLEESESGFYFYRPQELEITGLIETLQLDNAI